MIRVLFTTAEDLEFRAPEVELSHLKPKVFQQAALMLVVIHLEEASFKVLKCFPKRDLLNHSYQPALLAPLLATLNREITSADHKTK